MRRKVIKKNLVLQFHYESHLEALADEEWFVLMKKHQKAKDQYIARLDDYTYIMHRKIKVTQPTYLVKRMVPLKENVFLVIEATPVPLYIKIRIFPEIIKMRLNNDLYIYLRNEREQQIVRAIKSDIISHPLCSDTQRDFVSSNIANFLKL